MNREITRRDFLNGVGVTLTSSLLPTRQVSAFAAMMQQAEQEGQTSEYYPPTRTGMRGSHPGSFEVAHELEEQLAEGLSRTEWGGLLKALDKLTAHIKDVDEVEHEAAVD
jgi:hypothetical protein